MLSKFITVLAIVIALFAQTAAYSDMTCDMHDEAGSTKMTMGHASMDHASMNHNDMPAEAPEHDCCEGGSACPMSTCASIAYLSTTAEIRTAIYSDRLPIRHSIEATNTTTFSLYRPPIIA